MPRFPRKFVTIDLKSDLREVLNKMVKEDHDKDGETTQSSFVRCLIRKEYMERKYKLPAPPSALLVVPPPPNPEITP